MFYITKKNWDKILGYSEEAYNEHKSEIGGMSVMVEDKEGNWHLQNPVILKQEISAGNTVLEKEALAEYYTKEAMRMGKKNFRFCWWHSHHTMGAFWSGTDIKAIDEFNEGDFSFALVVNLKGEYKFRLSLWKPFEMHEDVELDIVGGTHRCTKKMKEEVEELCSKPVVTYNGTYNYQHWKNRTGVNLYSQSYTKRDQLLKEAAEDPRQERLPFHSTAGQMTVSGDNNMKSFMEIVEEVDSFGDDLTDGTITYKTYKESIEDLNEELEKESSPYKVNLIKEENKDDLLYIIPSQLVVYAHDDSEVSDIYMRDWGYGGYGI